jgi:hypothetical protein
VDRRAALSLTARGPRCEARRYAPVVHRLLVLVAALLAATSCSGGGEAAGSGAGGDSEVLGEVDEGIDGVQAVRVYYSSPVHTEGEVDYELRPPPGGMHAPVPWACGFYDVPVVDEQVVHTLEHGAVWLSYAPDLPPADVEAIHELVRQNDKVVAAPYEGLERGEAVVATAWARQLRLESADDPRLQRFVVQYQDGSQAPEAGVSCAGGEGTPIR